MEILTFVRIRRVSRSLLTVICEALALKDLKDLTAKRTKAAKMVFTTEDTGITEGGL